jgi:CheY-like chemotaxis protein
MVDLLIADDRAGTRDYLAKAFTERGITVAVCQDGYEAVTAVLRLWPGVVLCDVMAPLLDGFEVLRLLKSDAGTAEIPIILFGAYPEPTTQQRALDCGATAFVSKDIAFEELLSLVESVRTRRVG